MDDLIPRAASEQLRELVETFRIVLVNGPRQAGKTTLLHLYQRAYGGAYRSLDSAPDARHRRRRPGVVRPGR